MGRTQVVSQWGFCVFSCLLSTQSQEKNHYFLHLLLIFKENGHMVRNLIQLTTRLHNTVYTSPQVRLHVVGDVTVYGFDFNQLSLPTPFYSVLASNSVFMALSVVFHSVRSLNDSPLSHSVLLVLFLPYWSIQLYIYIFMKVQP